MRFLAIGECMAELAPSERDGAFSLGFAGDTFNTAWYLAQTAPDIEVAYLTAIGDDAISKKMHAFITASGIRDDAMQHRPGETAGLYMIHLEDGERSFSYWRDRSAARRLASDPETVKRAIDAADLIYYSGITLAILDPMSRETLFDALRAGQDAGKTVAFDTNLRPRLWTTAKEMTDTIERAAAEADIVLPSFDDEAVWFDDETPQATLKRYASLGTSRIIVKDGAGSVLYQDHTERGSVAVKPARNVVDTTAAGDSFNACVLNAVLQKRELAAGIAAGCQLATHVIQHKGALVPVPNQILSDWA